MTPLKRQQIRSAIRGVRHARLLMLNWRDGQVEEATHTQPVKYGRWQTVEIETRKRPLTADDYNELLDWHNLKLKSLRQLLRS